MSDKKSIEDLLSNLRANASTASSKASPVRNFAHLTDESVAKLYDAIRRQVDADKALGDRVRLVGDAAKERAERLSEELIRRELKFSPIVW